MKEKKRANRPGDCLRRPATAPRPVSVKSPVAAVLRKGDNGGTVKRLSMTSSDGLLPEFYLAQAARILGICRFLPHGRVVL